MGTKLEYARNLLAPSSNSTSFNVDFVDHLQSRGLNIDFKITGVDCRMPENQNIDFIRKTMQVHEDTFKHQVRELHRLYSVQKMLMEELRKEIKQTKKYWSPMATPDIIQSSYQYSSINVENLRDDPSPRERSGSCSGENIIRIARGLDLERPAEEDISTAVSVVDDNIPYKDTEVELTLSIGGSTSKKRASLNQEPGNRRMKELDFPAERAEDCSGPTTPMSSSSTATFDHERKQPHWLFQGLSINRTG